MLIFSSLRYPRVDEVAEESFCPFAFWRCEQYVSVVVLNYLAIVHKYYVVGRASRANFISCVTMIESYLGVEVLHNLEDFSDQLGIQCGCRFIIEHYPGVHCKRPGTAALWLCLRRV